MPTRDELVALLEQIGATSRPNQEVDARLICALLAPSGAFVELSRFNGCWCIHEPIGYGASRSRLWEGMPRELRQDGVSPTASIDAAMMVAERALLGRAGQDVLHDALDRMGREGFRLDVPTVGQIARYVIIEVLSALIAQHSEARHADA